MEDLKARLQELSAKLTSITAKQGQRIEALEQGSVDIDRMLQNRTVARESLQPACRQAQAHDGTGCVDCKGHLHETANSE